MPSLEYPYPLTCKSLDDPDRPKTYKLMDMDTLMTAFAKERGVKKDELYIPGMDM